MEFFHFISELEYYVVRLVDLPQMLESSKKDRKYAKNILRSLIPRIRNMNHFGQYEIDLSVSRNILNFLDSYETSIEDGNYSQSIKLSNNFLSYLIKEKQKKLISCKFYDFQIPQ